MVVGRALLVGTEAPSSCRVGSGAVSYSLDLQQAAAATTVAAVGRRDGLPDHAVTVALATALQESGLHNLSYGDRDSLGLFQQRPSQGWGSPAQIRDPVYAADAFYQRLRSVPGWATLATADAAQRVQHSAAPAAYSHWAAEAHLLAVALTGEVPAGLTCQLQARAARPAQPDLVGIARRELGLRSLTGPHPPAEGWTAAVWLVGHAAGLGVNRVAYDGMEWTPTTGAWNQSGTASGQLAVHQAPQGA